MSVAARRYCSHCNAAFASSIDKCPRDGADLQLRETNPLLGQVFGGRYRLVERLGAGGMGEVYRAEHLTIGKSFAIKVLLGEVAADNNMVARFHREARALSLLSHRNVVSVADFGETEEGLLYLVTEFVDGTPLTHELKKNAFDIERTIHVVRQIGRALSHAHRRGLVHRDLKPDNVMLVQEDDESDVVKVLDFGIARVADAETTDSLNRLTTHGIIMGTPAYIAPEQAMGTSVDHRADLYSLGILLYELLAGQLPFRGKSPIELMSKHLREAPPALTREDLSGEFKALTMCLLEKEPKNRFKDAETFLAVLEALEETRASGSYVRVPLETDDSVEDRPPMRQGSDTLLAPLPVLAAATANPSDAVESASSTAASSPTPRESNGSARTIGIALASAMAAAAAVLAMIYLGGAPSEPNPESPAVRPDAPAPLIGAQSEDAATVEVAGSEQAQSLPDAGLARRDAAAEREEREPKNERDKRARKDKRKKTGPPTQEELQKSVERVGKRLDVLARTMGGEEIDSLRRRWLDLATALPDIDSRPDARRGFALRLRKLRNAMKKVSANQ